MSGKTAARIAAPAAFLLAVTIAVLLVRAGLRHHPAAPVTTETTVTTTAARPRHPKKPHPKQAGAAGAYVTVQSGDTFYSIATRSGLSLDRLKALNPGVSPYAIHIGQRIRVK